MLIIVFNISLYYIKILGKAKTKLPLEDMRLAFSDFIYNLNCYYIFTVLMAFNIFHLVIYLLNLSSDISYDKLVLCFIWMVAYFLFYLFIKENNKIRYIILAIRNYNIIIDVVKKKLSYLFIFLLIRRCFNISLILILFFTLYLIEDTSIGSFLIYFYNLSLKEVLLEHGLLMSFILILSDLGAFISYILPPNIPGPPNTPGPSGGPGGPSGGPGGPPGGPGTPGGELGGPNRESNRFNRNSNVGNNSSVPFSEDQCNEYRKVVGDKLRQLFINKPSRTILNMSDPAHADKLTRLDHNMICKQILDTKSVSLYSKIEEDSSGHLIYTGVIGLRLLEVMENP